MTSTDNRIEQWRAAVTRGTAVRRDDVDELESHLREQLAELVAAGLDDDEAFLIAVKRLGQVDALTAEFAREHSDRLWKQLVLAPADDSADRRRGALPMVVFAAIGAAIILVAYLVAGSGTSFPGMWFARDAGLFLFPAVIAYLAWTRRDSPRIVVVLVAVVAALAVIVSVFPFSDSAMTGILVALHLPVVLWFVVGLAYLGDDWRSGARRMDFIRFSGEWAVYSVLLVLGGGVLFELTELVVSPIAPEVAGQLAPWILLPGAGALVVVAAWLVEAKKSIVENIAPVLTAIFTPLFAVMLVTASVGYLIAGFARRFDRELLTVFDVLLLVVLGLVLYGLSARREDRVARTLDVIRLVAICAALLLDILVIVSMFTRVGEFGLTANRVVALGLNLLLVVNLLGAAVLSVRALSGRVPESRLERWQTGYLPVFACWVVLVVVAVPVLFGFA